MFIFPLRTMAPCPYPPVVTLCLLGVMLLCSTMGWLNSDLFQAMKLSFQNIHMINWVSASLFHPSVGHFLLNALFIWVFGQLLEGRMGPATFLCVVSIGRLVGIWEANTHSLVSALIPMGIGFGGLEIPKRLFCQVQT